MSGGGRDHWILDEIKDAAQDFSKEFEEEQLTGYPSRWELTTGLRISMKVW